MGASDELHKSIGVPIARTFSGGSGSYVRVADVEYGFDEEHSDLMEHPVTILGKEATDAGLIKHGTMTLGMLGADKNNDGCTGICPQSILYGIAHHGSPPNTAIPIAMGVLRAGDVLLLEEQTWGENLPCETFGPTYDEIVKAVAAGIIVVEAAGNGDKNVDDILLGESGAVMVGSTHPSTNRGDRIDVVGPGMGVPSLVPGGGWDKNDFTGTSGASAVVAGVCALVSSINKAYRFDPIDSVGMQGILRRNGLDIDRILRDMFGCADWNEDGVVDAKDFWAAMPNIAKMRAAYDQRGKSWPTNYAFSGR